MKEYYQIGVPVDIHWSKVGIVVLLEDIGAGTAEVLAEEMIRG